MNLRIEENTLNAKDFIKLSKSVGWGQNRQYDMAKVEAALRDTTLCLSAINNNEEVIACARAFSDDLLMTFIPDIFVLPEYQKQGVGKILVNRLKDKYGHTSFFFGAQPGNESFFEKLGFEKSIQSYAGKFKDSPYY